MVVGRLLQRGTFTWTCFSVFSERSCPSAFARSRFQETYIPRYALFLFAWCSLQGFWWWDLPPFLRICHCKVTCMQKKIVSTNQSFKLVSLFIACAGFPCSQQARYIRSRRAASLP